MIGMNAPAPVGGRGGGGGGGGAGAATANTGDYLVTMSVSGQTFKQTFRVERVSGSGEAGFQFGEDENHDQNGKFLQKVPKAKQ